MRPLIGHMQTWPALEKEVNPALQHNSAWSSQSGGLQYLRKYALFRCFSR